MESMSRSRSRSRESHGTVLKSVKRKSEEIGWNDVEVWQSMDRKHETDSILVIITAKKNMFCLNNAE